MPQFILLLLIWMLMSGSLEWAEWFVGAAVALLVVMLSRQSQHDKSGGAAVIFSVDALIALFRYLSLFFVALVRANLDMARRVLTPSLPIAPVLVEVETGLQSSLGRLMLANSITLTPGTLTVEVEEDRLLVHWIDGSLLEGDEEDQARLQLATEQIAAPFEQQLKGFLR